MRQDRYGCFSGPGQHLSTPQLAPHLSTISYSSQVLKKLWERVEERLQKLRKGPETPLKKSSSWSTSPHGHPKGFSPYSCFSSILQQDHLWPINKLMSCCRMAFFLIPPLKFLESIPFLHTKRCDNFLRTQNRSNCSENKNVICM